MKFSGKKQARSVGLCQNTNENVIALVSSRDKALPQVLQCQTFLTDVDLFDFLHKQQARHLPCVEVLSVSEYLQSQVDLAGVPKAEGREAARWQLAERLDYPAEDAVIDLFDIGLDETSTNFLSFAVAARQSTLKDHLARLKRPELKLLAIDTPEFCLRNLLELFPEQARGICLLWMQSDATLLLVVREGCVYFSRLIPVGLTPLIQNEEQNSAQLLAESNERILDDLILEIQRSLDFCESRFRLPSISQIWLACCGDEPDHVVDYLNRYLQAEVRPADFRQVFDFNCDVSTATINSCLPALGAALRAGGSL